MKLIDRRSLLKTTTVATGSLMSGRFLPLAKSLWENTKSTSLARFDHRGYLGWITDLATDADSHAAWPSMRLDGRLLSDYRQTFRLMKEAGFNEISV